MNEYLKQLGSTEFDNFHELELKIETRRSTYHHVEPKLLENKNICMDANRISSLQNGRVDFYLAGVTFQTFIHLGNKPTLYVFLNGSLKNNAPEFNRWSYYSVIDGTVINIADPMYILYPNLKLGWYYGNDEVDLRRITASLVIKIADYLGISNESIIFFGSSGGGAATFEISYYCPKSMAVAINPQIRLADWGTQGNMLEKTVGIVLENDKWHREDALWFLKQNKQSIYFLIVNLKSEADMKQLERIKKELKINIHYGLNCYSNLIIWIYEADGSPYVSPHSSQEFHSIFNVIDYLCEQVQNKSINEKTKELVLLINDCWMEQWEKEKEIYEKKVNLSRFLKIRNEKRIITLFGAGNLMQSFDKEYFRIKKDNLYNIGLILDNNADKNGLQYAKDVKILCPAKQKIDWKNLFIIIMIKNDIKEIIAQLEQQGLQYEVDFILYNDIFEK